MSWLNWFSIGDKDQSDFDNGLLYLKEIFSMYQKSSFYNANYSSFDVWLQKFVADSKLTYNATVEGVGLLARVKDYDDDDLLEAGQNMVNAGANNYQQYNFYLTGASIPSQIQDSIEQTAITVKDDVTSGIKKTYDTVKAIGSTALDASANAAKSLMNLPTLIAIIVFLLVGGLIYTFYKKGIKGIKGA